MNTHNKDRQEGYYWVKRNGHWYIGHYYTFSWHLTISDRSFMDYHMDLINEERIKEPNEA